MMPALFVWSKLVERLRSVVTFSRLLSFLCGCVDNEDNENEANCYCMLYLAIVLACANVW